MFKKSKKKNAMKNTLFATVGLVIAIVVAFLIAAYVSDDKHVTSPQYGNTLLHPPTKAHH